MKNDYIDLGCGLDSGPAYATNPAPDSAKKSYPCFYFTCDEEIELPDGEFVFSAKGRKVEDSENMRDPENPRYRYEIEVHGFKPEGTVRSDKGMVSMADAFKKGLDKKMMEKMDGEGE